MIDNEIQNSIEICASTYADSHMQWAALHILVL